MTKSIIMSVSPEEACDILNGNQTALLRKRIPKDYKGWVYCYVRKGKPYLYNFANLDYGISNEFINQQYHKLLNNTIPFRFWYDDHIEYEHQKDNTYFPKRIEDFNKCSGDMVLRKLNISREDFKKYGNGKDLYVLKIDKLEIFDKPMQLSEFYTTIIPQSKLLKDEYVDFKTLSKSPKTFQYVWVKEGEQK